MENQKFLQEYRRKLEACLPEGVSDEERNALVQKVLTEMLG